MSEATPVLRPAMDRTLFIGHASEADCRAARRNATQIAHWVLTGQQFYMDPALLVIVRAKGDGIDGGWKYATLGALNTDWASISRVAFVTGGLGALSGRTTTVSPGNRWADRTPGVSPN